MGFPDKRFADRSIRSDNHDNPYFDPNKPVISSRVLNKSAEGLAVIFPPWHNGGRAITRLAERYTKEGWAVLLPRFADEILKPDVGEVKTAFHAIADQMSEHITALQDREHYRTTHYVGPSLGGVSLAMTAAQTAFDSAQFIASGSDLAGATWNGYRTREIKDSFEDQGVSYEELAGAWYDLAPKTHAAAFSGKQVGVVISDTDEIIPTPYQNELSRTLTDHASVNPTHTLLGHYFSIGRYCFRGALPSPGSIII